MIYSYQQLGSWGRLGNQLFQIAGTLGEAIRDGANVSFPSWDYQQYFSVPAIFFDGKIGDKDFSGDYMQNLKHFSHVEHLIRSFFKPSKLSEDYINTRYADILGVENTTALHVRRGDYANFPQHHPICNMEFFERAIDKIGATQLVVFSDDLTWCKQQDLFKDAYFADGNEDNVDPTLPTPAVVHDLFLMTRMEKHIISNSTFSWWGAWLANREVAVYPMPWYGPALDIDVEETMIPQHWMRVERVLS